MKHLNISGLRFKVMMFTFFLVISSVGAAAFIAYLDQSRELVSREQERVSHAAEIAGIQIASALEVFQQDVLSLANMPPVTGLARAQQNGGIDSLDGASSKMLRARLAQIFAQTIRTNPAYQQLRLIGIQNNGREIVRVNRKKRSSGTVPDDFLQSKGHRQYFKDAINLDPGQTSLSDLDLNRENGEVEIPHRLVIRALTPVYGPDGQVFAIVVLNADMSTILDRPRRQVSADRFFYVSNHNGDFLLHPDKKKESAFEFNSPYKLQDEFPQYDRVFTTTGDSVSAAIINNAGGRKIILGVYDIALGTEQKTKFLRVVQAASYRDVISAALVSNIPLGVGMLLIMILTLSLGLFFAHNVFSKPLSEITGSIEGHVPGKPLAMLPTNRNDEIGVLARAFAQLVEETEQRRLSVQRQILKRRQTEEKIRYLAAAVENATDAIAILGRDCVYQYVNPAYERQRHCRAAEVLGKKPWELPHRRNAGSDYRAMWQSVLDGGPHTGQYTTTTADGRNLLEDTTVSPIKDASGTVTGLVAVIRDVTERIRLERQRKQAEERAARFSRVLERSMNEIYIFDAETLHFIDVNQGARKNLGYSMKELFDMTPLDLKPEFTRASFTELLEPLRTGDQKMGRFTTVHRRKDGTQYPVEVYLQLVTDSHPVFCAVILDVTERMQAEETKQKLEGQLRQAQKLESIGQLAAGIAHEINTPTQYVSDNTVFLQSAFDGLLEAVQGSEQLLEAARQGTLGADRIAQFETVLNKARLDFLQEHVPQAFEQSLEGLERVSRIVGAMKEFSHPAQEKTNVDLNRAIQSTITVASNEWKYVAEMHTEFDPELPLVSCLPGEFNQVILSIIVNAAHAIDDVVGDGADGRGVITVSTHHSDEWAEIRISDTGAGMPTGVQERVFDTFFTTKEVGKGTGQGLSIAYNLVVEKHGGSIEVESEPGKGATFVIRLPLQTPTMETEETKEQAA